MKKYVIIGAGPSGLYLSLQLKKHGLNTNSIIVYDPRAGNYTRPGDIGIAVFKRAEQTLKTKFPFQRSSAHIRNIEKELYKYAKQENIVIENKQFMRFAEEEQGIIIAYKDKDQKLIEKFIACDYVFDCTGSKRSLVHAMNLRKESLGEAKPFELTPVTNNVSIKNHLIAYVRIERSLTLGFENSPNYRTFNIEKKAPAEYMATVEKLRQFGWTEFSAPDCYKLNFPNNKTCIYTECPPNLNDEARKVQWLTTVMEVITKKENISFELITEKKSGAPHLTTFTVNPQQLNQFTHQEQGLPSLIVLGDGQIEPNYTLGHGILGAFQRIDLLMTAMKIINGELTSFNQDTYQQALHSSLIKHRKAIIEHYESRHSHLVDSLYKATASYEKAYNAANPNEQEFIKFRLDEIYCRIDYYQALDLLQSNKLLQKLLKGKEVLDLTTPNLIINECKTVKILLEQALINLPGDEKINAIAQLKNLVHIFHNIGDELKRKGNRYLSTKTYEDALVIYSTNRLPFDLEFIQLQAKLISSYLKLKELEKVIEQTYEVLKLGQLIPDFLKQKILFNFIKAVYESDNSSSWGDQNIDDQLANEILATFEDYIDNHLRAHLKVELMDIWERRTSEREEEKLILKL